MLDKTKLFWMGDRECTYEGSDSRNPEFCCVRFSDNGLLANVPISELDTNASERRIHGTVKFS
jgi:hypothetical protein